jgi:alpha-L-fucosidase
VTHSCSGRQGAAREHAALRRSDGSLRSHGARLRWRVPAPRLAAEGPDGAAGERCRPGEPRRALTGRSPARPGGTRAKGRATAIALALALGASPAPAQVGYVPSAANLAAREWFRDAKFGMFIHWGVYSVLQDDAWVSNTRRLHLSEYETLAPQFHPTRFNAAEWVALAKAAGARYITFTTKHHDGFAMWDSHVSDWNIVARTPFRRDVVRELADECRRQGIRLFIYYSQLDWHHPDFYPRGGTGRWMGRPDSGDFNRYLDFLDAQVRELLTNYGDLAGIWFDGQWDKGGDWRLGRTYRMIHDLQPAALLGSNTNGWLQAGEDLALFERMLPGTQSARLDSARAQGVPLEMSETINGSWGFRLWDRDHKSTDQLIRELVEAAGQDANLLLNVGPMPTGEIQPQFVERMRAIGAWLQRSGESIYGTRGGPIAPRPWGVTTQKGDRVYVHVLDWRDPELALPSLPRRVRSASLLVGGARLPFRETPAGVTLTLPPRAAGEVDQIVVLELASAPARR